MKILYRRICVLQFELTLLQRKQKGSVFHINMIFRVQCTSHYKEMQNKIALWGLLWDRVHRPQPSNLTFYKEIRLDRKAYYELLIGLLQRPARDPVCRGQPAYGHLTGFICWGPFPYGSCRWKDRVRRQTAFRRSTPDSSSRWSTEVISTRGYVRQTTGIEISVFPLLGELTMTIKPRLQACQLYRWQLVPNRSSLPTPKSIDHIIFSALQVGFTSESLASVTGGFACNCPVPVV